MTGASAAEAPLWAWLVFGAGLLALLAIDLVAHRGSRLRSQAAAITWTAAWVAVGLLFTFFVWAVLDARRAGEYIAAYLVEKSLSLDNLFIFIVVFHALNVPHDNQRSILTWGILGALVFRLAFVFAGIAAMERFHWVVYLFAAVLLGAAVRVFREDPARKKDTAAVRWLSRHVPVTPTFHGNKFFTKEGGRRLATPLFVALCAVEVTDLAFAIDSIPAALSISQSSFVVYSSNALAVLGLRSLYVVLERSMGTLKYLHYGLAAVLAFAAFKLLASRWFEIPPAVAVGVIVLCIGASIGPSVRARRKQPLPAPA